MRIYHEEYFYTIYNVSLSIVYQESDRDGAGVCLSYDGKFEGCSSAYTGSYLVAALYRGLG